MEMEFEGFVTSIIKIERKKSMELGSTRRMRMMMDEDKVKRKLALEQIGKDLVLQLCGRNNIFRYLIVS